MEKIKFEAEGETAEFFVLEETKIAGVSYLLVTDTEDEEAEEAVCYILKELREEEAETVYEMVEDEDEINYISRIFEELLEDTEILPEE